MYNFLMHFEKKLLGPLEGGFPPNRRRLRIFGANFQSLHTNGCPHQPS